MPTATAACVPPPRWGDGSRLYYVFFQRDRRQNSSRGKESPTQASKYPRRRSDGAEPETRVHPGEVGDVRVRSICLRVFVILWVAQDAPAADVRAPAKVDRG